VSCIHKTLMMYVWNFSRVRGSELPIPRPAEVSRTQQIKWQMGGIPWGTQEMLMSLSSVILSVAHGHAVRRQTYGCHHSRGSSPIIGRYQITLLGDRGTCVCVCVCVNNLPRIATTWKRGRQESNLLIKSSALTTMSPSHTQVQPWNGWILSRSVLNW